MTQRNVTNSLPRKIYSLGEVSGYTKVFFQRILNVTEARDREIYLGLNSTKPKLVQKEINMLLECPRKDQTL